MPDNSFSSALDTLPVPFEGTPSPGHAKAREIMRQRKPSPKRYVPHKEARLAGPVPAPASIAELARALKNDVDLIYEWVYTNVDFYPMWGVHKGAFGTLIDQLGGSFEQSSLMVALLREAGYTANFVFGEIRLDAADIEAFLGTDDSVVHTTSWIILENGQIPNTPHYEFVGGPLEYIDFSHVWVKVEIDSVDYVFDPSYKTYYDHKPVNPNLPTAIDYDQTTLINDAEDGATITSESITEFNEANVRADFATYGTNLLTWIQENAFDASLADIIGGRKIQPLPPGPVRQTSLPYENASPTPEDWTDIPEEFFATYEFTYQGINEKFLSSDIYGKRLSVTFNGSDQPELRLDGSLIATGSTVDPDLFYTATFEIVHPFVLLFANQTWTQKLQGNGTHILGNSWGPGSQSMADYHQQLLLQNIVDGGGDSDEDVLGESLEIFWFMHRAQGNKIEEIYQQLGSSQIFWYHFAGVAGYIDYYQSPYFDLAGLRKNVRSLEGDSTTAKKVHTATALITDGLEAGIMQQNLPASGVATSSMLSAANADLQKIFDTTSSNWMSSVRAQLTNWTNLAFLDAQIAGGSRLIIHEDGTTSLGDYVGGGWHEANGLSMAAWISGHILGGATSVPISPGQTKDGARKAPKKTKTDDEPDCGDPISFFSGAYEYSRSDISVGSGTFPYKLEFSRSYSSSNRYSDGPLGLGWTHNFANGMQSGSNGMRVAGETSPKEAAAAIAHAYVLIQLGLDEESTPSLTKLLIGTLSTLWLMDQMTNNSVTLSANGQSRSFIKLVDGTYSPPPGYADTLVVNVDDTYTMTSPQQLQWNFNALGQMTSFVDPAGVTVEYSYNMSNELTSVTNGLDRTLTFTYDTGRLTEVGDGSRSVTFLVDGNSNLTEFTDTLDKTIVYDYVEPGLLTEIFLPAFPATAYLTNEYDSLGRIMTQQLANAGVYTFYFSGWRTEQVDPVGNSYISFFNEIGMLTKEVNALDQQTLYEYDGLNRRIKTTLPEENFTEWTYDEKNNVLTQTSTPKPGSLLAPIELIFTYDPDWNKVATYTDANNNTTTYTYDGTPRAGQGTLLTIERPTIGVDVPTVTFTYTGRGQLETRTDETGIVDKFVYDGTDETLLTATRDFGGLNLETAYGYDSVGNVTSITDPNGNTTTSDFNNERRLIERTAPSPFSYVISWGYNANGWRTAFQRETGDPMKPLQIWTWAYHEDGSVETITDPAENVLTFGYDTLDRVNSITDAEEREWAIAYDELSRISTVTDPLTNVAETRTYTDNGKLASIEDANSNVTNYEYDDFDRLDKRTFPDDTFEHYEYDPNSNALVLTTRNTDDITNTFDVLNRLLTRQPGTLPLQTMTHDLAGRLLNINNDNPGEPTDGDYGFAYDTAGRLTEQSTPDTKTVTYELDNNGNRIKLTYPDGYYAQYFYDELNRLTDIKLNGSGTAAIHFDYDALSRRTATTYENGCECAYVYELNNDLASLTHAFVGSSVAFGFDYNKVHQVIGQSVGDDQFMWIPSESSTVSYDPVNNLNQYPEVDSAPYSYNANGCLTGGVFTASFDELNRMTQAILGGTTDDFWYDPLNRQAQKAINSVNIGFLYDGQQMLEEYDDVGDLAYRYVRGNQIDEIFIKIAGSTKTYFHHDRLGSIVAQSDAAGGVLNTYQYSPFGETPDLSGTPFGYTGQRYDSELALYNYKARVYSPAIGRFLQPDPIGFTAGDMNLYSYVNNDASNLTDPFGLQETICSCNGCSGQVPEGDTPKLKTFPGVLGIPPLKVPGSTQPPTPQSPGIFPPPDLSESGFFRVPQFVESTQTPQSIYPPLPPVLAPIFPPRVPSFGGFDFAPAPNIDAGPIMIPLPPLDDDCVPEDSDWRHKKSPDVSPEFKRELKRYQRSQGLIT